MPAWSAASKPRIDGPDPVGDVRDRRQDALAAVACLVAVPKLDGLVDARRGAGRDRGPAQRAVLGDDVDLDGRVAPRVEDLPGIDPGDGGVAHLAASGWRSRSTVTPGSSRPSRNSSEAPPPVLMWVILSARPCWVIAATESPPPITTAAPSLGAVGEEPGDGLGAVRERAGSRTRPAGRSRARSARRPAPPRCSRGSACRGPRCASWPGPSRRRSSCTRCRG